MKKIFVLILLTAICSSSAFAVPPSNQSREQVRKNFEKRLNLSDKQKELAKEIHQSGLDKMKVVIYAKKLKYDEIKQIQGSSLPDDTKDEKISAIKSDIKSLDQKAHDIRVENSKEFEKILNKKQKKEIELMKAEGRANFAKHHAPRKPFQEFRVPGFWESGRLFPQLNPLSNEFVK